MSNDRYCKPIIRAICKQGDAVHFFTGYEVPYLEKTLDCTGRDGERAWTSGYYR